jgi:hypothetical protein
MAPPPPGRTLEVAAFPGQEKGHPVRTIDPLSSGALARPILVLALAGVLTLGVAAPSSGTDRRAGAHERATLATVRPTITLNSVGSRYVAGSIPIKGYSWGASRGSHRIALQRYAPLRHRWFTHAVTYADTGAYRFRPRHVWSPRTVRFRAVLYDDGRRVAVSKVITVVVIARPAP